MASSNKDRNTAAQDAAPAAVATIDPRTQEIDTAAAFLMIEGPCRQVANIYLACVATAGLGQCRHLRASFADCAKQFRTEAQEQLELIGMQQCAKQNDKVLCAAQLALRHYLPSRADQDEHDEE